MNRSFRVVAGVGLAISAAAVLQAQAPVSAPVPQVREVADGVYIFEYRGYQSMFVVAPAGVVVTDPISQETAKVYLAEVRKLTAAPIRYVVYSHHHFDHIAGGAPFKEAGAVFVAHRNARAQLERLKNPTVVLPEQLVDDRATLTVGSTRVDLHYLGRNHSDNSLVVSVPQQRVIYAADWLPLGELIWRNVFDSYVDEWFEGIDRVLALEWERLVVGHARAHNPKGWGTKDDVRAFKGNMPSHSERVRRNYPPEPKRPADQDPPAAQQPGPPGRPDETGSDQPQPNPEPPLPRPERP
jgi:glyoxylase-like metal-dependent hydrolase (beta-lactamase superfamily II)